MLLINFISTYIFISMAKQTIKYITALNINAYIDNWIQNTIRTS